MNQDKAVDDKIFEKLSLLYQENSKIAAVFWEWRNKILTYFFTAISALIVATGWLYQRHPGRYLSVPLFLGFILSTASFFLDKRNEDILRACYRFGGDFEDQLLSTINEKHRSNSRVASKRGAIFNFIGEAHREAKPLKIKTTYTHTLRATFGIVGALLLLLSVINLIRPITLG